MRKEEPDSLGRVRQDIDQIDRALVRLLAERFSCIQRAAQLKKDPEEALVAWRVAEVAQKIRESARDVGFSPDLAEEIWQFMMARCIAFEKEQIIALKKKNIEQERKKR